MCTISGGSLRLAGRPRDAGDNNFNGSLSPLAALRAKQLLIEGNELGIDEPVAVVVSGAACGAAPLGRECTRAVGLS